MFLWVTTTAAGERVEPEVYCSTAFLVRGAGGAWKFGSASRSRLSTSISAGALPGSERAQPTTSSTTAEVVSRHGRSAVLQSRRGPLVVGAELRDGQRHRDQPGLQRGVEGNDVFQALRRKDGGTVPRRSAGRDLSGQRLHAAVQLGPCERLASSRPDRSRSRCTCRPAHRVAARPNPAALRQSRHRLLPSGHHPSKSRAPDNN